MRSQSGQVSALVSIHLPTEGETMTDLETDDCQSLLCGDSATSGTSDFEVWTQTVRDPANVAAEGLRRMTSRNGKAVAEYNIAPLPDGRWAVQTRLEYCCGDFSGVGTPWTALPTRQDCIDLFRSAAIRHFSQPIDQRTSASSQQIARRQMLACLTDTGLFGFMEPPIVGID